MDGRKYDSSDNDDDDDDYSADEALAELLGLPSDVMAHAFSSEDESSGQCGSRTIHDLLHEIARIETLVAQHGLRETYQNTSVCVFPEELSIPAAIMRRLADEAVVGSTSHQNDKKTALLPGVQRTYETITKVKNGTNGVVHARELTRLENLRGHGEWKQCDEYIGTIVSALLQRQQVLYKTKLNLKPSGGAGFAPHVDTPSLRLVFPDIFSANESFCTVMIAIDDMTVLNGCLRVAKRPLSEGPVDVVPPRLDANPDGDGRAGALMDGEQYTYEDIECPGGTIVAFDGWVPHRSGVNNSMFGRRAVFLTYHDAAIGDLHDLYYERMRQVRNSFAEEQRRRQQQQDVATQNETQAVNEESAFVPDALEYVALASVPK